MISFQWDMFLEKNVIVNDPKLVEAMKYAYYSGAAAAIEELRALTQLHSEMNSPRKEFTDNWERRVEEVRDYFRWVEKALDSGQMESVTRYTQ